MTVLYDLVNLLFMIAYLPVFFFRKKMHAGFSRRLGRYPRDMAFSRPVWIHAVSVGEMVNMRRFFQTLSLDFPNEQYVFSTVTPTGNTIAAGIARPDDIVTYLPLDVSGIVNSVLDRIRPRLFIIAETEFWPNLLSSLHRRNIPVIIVNGRISDKAVAGYLKIRWVIAPLLSRISLLCMQSQADADRVIALGARPECVKITGNMKFDQGASPSIKRNTERRMQLGIAAGEQCIVAGSTHPGEEEQVLSAYKATVTRHPSARLIIVPRHPQRGPEVAACVRAYGFEPLRVSEMRSSSRSATAVFIVDTIGELMSYYAIADAVFVGGSLIRHGGQNFLEPAFLDKPVILGPSLFNFRDIARQFLDRKAAILVHDAGELATAFHELLSDRDKVSVLVERARGLIQQNLGATQRNLSYIKAFMQVKDS